MDVSLDNAIFKDMWRICSKLVLCIIESILGIHAFISPICRDMQKYVEGSIDNITSDIQ
jgi:hypothetical protein